MKNNPKLTQLVQAKTGVTKKVAEQHIEAVLTAIQELANSEGKLSIKEYGVFSYRDSAPRVARNPKTGIQVNVPAKRTFIFKVAKK